MNAGALATCADDESSALTVAEGSARGVVELAALVIELATRRIEGITVVSCSSSNVAALESILEKRGCGIGVSDLGLMSAECAEAPG